MVAPERVPGDPTGADRSWQKIGVRPAPSSADRHRREPSRDASLACQERAPIAALPRWPANHAACQSGSENIPETARKWGEKSSRKGDPAGDKARARVVTRAADVLLTHGVYSIGLGWACRAEPKERAASEMSPNPAPLLP